MTTLRNVRTLTRYMAWANDRIFAAVAALPEGEATKPRRSVFKNIVHTLNHVYVIDLIFQAHLEGREHGFTVRNTPDHPPLDELRHMQRKLEDRKSTRLNSSHQIISYAVFCLKKKKTADTFLETLRITPRNDSTTSPSTAG